MSNLPASAGLGETWGHRPGRAEPRLGPERDPPPPSPSPGEGTSGMRWGRAWRARTRALPVPRRLRAPPRAPGPKGEWRAPPARRLPSAPSCSRKPARGAPRSFWPHLTDGDTEALGDTLCGPPSSVTFTGCAALKTKNEISFPNRAGGLGAGTTARGAGSGFAKRTVGSRASRRGGPPRHEAAWPGFSAPGRLRLEERAPTRGSRGSVPGRRRGRLFSLSSGPGPRAPGAGSRRRRPRPRGPVPGRPRGPGSGETKLLPA